MSISDDQVRLAVTHLDVKNKWAPIHYAVYHNNKFIFEKLTKKNGDEKKFFCGQFSIELIM